MPPRGEPGSSPWWRSAPLGIRLGRQLVGASACPVELLHARPHTVAARLEGVQDGALVGGQYAPAVDDETAVDVDAIHVLRRRVVDEVLHRIPERRHAPGPALPEDEIGLRT